MSRLLLASAVIGAALIASIAWELQDSPNSDLAPSAGRSSGQQGARAAPPTETGDVVQSWMATALARPLFREDRRPVRTAGDPARNGNEGLRLTGVITGPFGNRAIFQSGDAAKPIVAQEKALLNGFLVRSIEPGKAVIEEPGGNVRTLTPSFTETEQTPRRAN